jgi:hypothetical protein
MPSAENRGRSLLHLVHVPTATARVIEVRPRSSCCVDSSCCRVLNRLCCSAMQIPEVPAFAVCFDRDRSLVVLRQGETTLRLGVATKWVPKSAKVRTVYTVLWFGFGR